MQNIYKYLKYAIGGEKRTEREHDIMVFKKSEELALKYGIEYDPKVFVPDDLEMGDAVFEAGIELLHSVGIFCRSTQRVINIDEEDILKALNTTNPLEIGRLKEKVVVPHRYPMISFPPVIIGGPTGGSVSEQNFLYINLSSVQENVVQGIYSGAMNQFGGEYIQPRSPLEMLAVLKASRNERLATKIGGREGLALMGPSTSTLTTSSLLVSSDELYSTCDPQEVYMDDLKVDYETLSKCIYHQEHGNHYITGQVPVFGGPCIGSPEGLAIMDVAETLQSKVLAHSSIHACGAVHANTGSSSAKEIMWASNLASLGISRNMNYYTARYYWNTAGICTDMMFYETAAQAIGDTVCGRNMLLGPSGRRGSAPDHSSGLESRFMGEMAQLATQLNLTEANNLVSKIYSKYANRLNNPPEGKPFEKCYNIRSEYDMEPTEEYLALYRKISYEIMGDMPGEPV
ncbi:MAG: methylamine---corrinoid protein Co-methyltransferase [Methanolobus sp.]|jgi:methylamine--corrinoid protein Co-methyltransferase|uniref:[methylamine--corrinoid protein] Co-methyltransferase n=1 Tax=Methanolobus tindarius DSM 2278 TaxID=1090322 RepID=W9DRG7_METTI|nr:MULTISPECIES: monomethylamine:corrinoid methyltransferase [Methanolobus]ETA68120.1 Monomethylamine methyltransferase MtmB [Methanolobus tindarius DSM 2278]MDI3485329.1 methylamine---corrinoid protein Co-methyltransferase [Methanolobus sp.]MDK2830732.1 methylamine---corrinoid protein Co-methyltransferase [Methanolobus sp.]MDK2939465.1 methylamine---corrinoid protein Co-methyltransferase [Methanolobus sp.]